MDQLGHGRRPLSLQVAGCRLIGAGIDGVLTASIRRTTRKLRMGEAIVATLFGG